ncbi:ferri-bacillibactin esterase BesA [Insolitispirillum peregrinum]
MVGMMGKRARQWMRRIGLGMLMSMLAACATAPAAVSIPRSEDLPVVNSKTGEAYRLLIWRPASPPPPDGWPVVYLLDANSVFGMVTDIMNSRSESVGKTGVRPAVVVGIAYPTDAAYDLTRRTRDLTPSVDPQTLPMRPNGQPWSETGGADEFLRFLHQQVKPLVAARLPVNPQQDVLMGHSFGGLFTLHTLLSHPDAFHSYVAGSPSLWFGNGALLQQAKAVVTSSTTDSTGRRVLMVTGGDEERLTATEQAQPDAARRLAWKQGNRMLGNAQEMRTLLAALPGLAVDYREHPGLDHGSVVPMYLYDGLMFALSPTSPAATGTASAPR